MNFSNFNKEQIQEAREKVAVEKEKLSESCLNGEVQFASHVTDEYKKERSVKYQQLADEIRKGEHDNNLTTRQKIYYHLTGKSVPLMNI